MRPSLKHFTIAEVADRLGVLHKTVRRRLANGDLHHHRIGGAIRIADEDLATFLAARRR